MTQILSFKYAITAREECLKAFFYKHICDSDDKIVGFNKSINNIIDERSSILKIYIYTHPINQYSLLILIYKL